MKKMSKKLGMALTAALIATTVMTGCKDKGGETAAKSATKTEKKAELFSEWKPAEMQKAMQGTFKVGSSTWTVDGDKVTIKSKTKTKEATLDLSTPFEAKIVVPMAGGGKSWDTYAVTCNGADVYLGFGTMGMVSGEKYLVGKDGVVVFDGKECKYYAEAGFGQKGFKDPVKVKGEVTEKDGKKVFTFEVPNKFKQGEFKSYSVEVVGTALVDDLNDLIKK